jgi:hypothetical protein
MVSRKCRSSSFPTRKISETFLDFAAPFVSLIDRNTTEHQIRQGFKIAYTVWNAVVLDAVNGNNEYIKEIHRLTSQDPESTALLDRLIARKRALFNEDQRLIGEYKVTYKRGRLHVRADARLLQRHHKSKKSK